MLLFADGQKDGLTDRHYQFYYLPASQKLCCRYKCFASTYQLGAYMFPGSGNGACKNNIQESYEVFFLVRSHVMSELNLMSETNLSSRS